MIKEYLEVSRPDERYCEGCPCIYYVPQSGYMCCSLNISLDYRKPKPPNCPLVKFSKNWQDIYEPSENK